MFSLRNDPGVMYLPGMSLKTKIRVRVITAVFLSCQSLCAYADGQARFYESRTEKPLAQVLDDAEFAITERNFRITGRLHIGKGIRERGNAGFPDYEVILFCNLSYAERMLELEPEYVNYCPGRITFRNDGGTIIISASLVPEDPDNPGLNTLVKEINRQLRDIVDFSVQKWSPTRTHN